MLAEDGVRNSGMTGPDLGECVRMALKSQRYDLADACTRAYLESSACCEEDLELLGGLGRRVLDGLR